MRVLLIVYDNGSHIPVFPQGIAYLAAALRQEKGVEVALYLQDIHHYPDEHLTHHLDNNYYDFVGLSFIGGYYQYRKALAICAAVKSSKSRPTLVLGGHGPAADPEYFIEKTGADVVVVGEGEDSIKEIINGNFKKGSWLWTKPRENPDELPIPAYDLFPIDIYRLSRFPHSTATDFCMPVLSGRGCPYACTFCFRMDKGFRARSVESVLGEIMGLQKEYGINHFQFSDELLMSSKGRTVKFAEAIIRAALGIKWDCNGRLNHATPEVLEVMKRAGCTYINYGIEALDDAVLKGMRKGLRVSQIYRGVEATIAAGISPGLNIMWGNYGDTEETLEKAVAFLKKYDGTAELRTVRPVTPYPGTELFRDAVQRGLCKGTGDFYENKHTNSDLFSISFMDSISEREGDLVLAKANSELVAAYYRRCAVAEIKRGLKFYYGKTPANEFRGWRPV